MKEKFGFDFLPNFDCVYSFAKIERDLAELDEEKKQNIEQIKINFNERIRSLPVFAFLFHHYDIYMLLSLKNCQFYTFPNLLYFVMMDLFL